MAIGLVPVDEHVVVRMGLAQLAIENVDIRLLGEAGSAAAALRVVADVRPDVVTLAMHLPDADGIATAGRLRELLPDLGVVLLTSVGDDAQMFRAMAAGLSAYVLKSAPIPVLVAAIRHAAVAPHAFTAAGLSVLLHRQRRGAGLLSGRELQVLSLMGEGDNTASIAARLFVSEATVKTYASRIYGKLKVNNRAQALMVAVNQGLLLSESDQSRAAA
jgi:DNA-binding NarL/FixJ family response regulator